MQGMGSFHRFIPGQRRSLSPRHSLQLRRSRLPILHALVSAQIQLRERSSLLSLPHSLDDRIQAKLASLRSLPSILDPLAVSDSVIPNDLLLTAFTPHQLVLGPNCSGKTTFIKQIGVACVLAQLGCFVPAQYGHVPIFESLAMCGGEEESIESGLSSFAREVRCIRDVFDGLSGCSLLLCDEFGKR